MEETLAYIWGYGLLCLMVFILIAVLLCKFVIYLIKCGVKNALEEISFTDALENAITIGVLQALEDFNKKNQNERPTE